MTHVIFQVVSLWGDEMNIHLPQTEEARAEAGASSGTSGTLKYTQVSSYGFVWKCWVNIPNEIAI